ncbi:MAG: hypothetical protein ACLVJH_17850 [Faecalibacterium prausnitzii]
MAIPPVNDDGCPQPPLSGRGIQAVCAGRRARLFNVSMETLSMGMSWRL